SLEGPNSWDRSCLLLMRAFLAWAISGARPLGGPLLPPVPATPDVVKLPTLRAAERRFGDRIPAVKWLVPVRHCHQGGPTGKDEPPATPHARRPLVRRAGHQATTPRARSRPEPGRTGTTTLCPSPEGPNSADLWKIGMYT